MIELVERALSHPDYGLVVALILGEIAAVQLQIGWLVAAAVGLRGRDRRTRRFAAELGDGLADLLIGADPQAREAWLHRARAHPAAVLRAHLEPLLSITAGTAHDEVAGLYRALGLLATDVAMSRSRLLSRRVRALRRLSLEAGPGEAALLLERRHDHHIVRVLAVQMLVRLGTPEQVLSMVRGLRPSTRLLEQPIAETLSSAPAPVIERLLAELGAIEDPGMRRLVLAASARAAPAACLRRLAEAAADPSVEVRIGTCQAAAVLRDPELGPLVTELLRDPAPEVRAQAAKALGRIGAASALEPLVGALTDRAFWVRQNAAAALGALGAAGRRRLQEVVDGSTDRFAIDTARQELKRRELLASEATAS